MKKLILLFLIALISNLAYSQSCVMNEEAKRYYSRGVSATKIAQSTDDYKNALAEYQKATELCPDCSELYYRMGLCCEIIGENDSSYYSSALKYFQKSLTAEGDISQELKELIQSKIYEMEYAVEQVAVANKDALTSENLCGKWIFHTSNGETNELYDIVISQNQGLYSVKYVFMANFYGKEDNIKPDFPDYIREESANINFKDNVVCFSTAHIYALFAPPERNCSKKIGPQDYHNRYNFDYELILENGVLKGVSKCVYHFEAMGNRNYSTVMAAFRDGRAKVFSNCEGNCGSSNIYFTR